MHISPHSVEVHFPVTFNVDTETEQNHFYNFVPPMDLFYCFIVLTFGTVYIETRDLQIHAGQLSTTQLPC